MRIRVGIIAVCFGVVAPTAFSQQELTDLRLVSAQNQFGFKIFSALNKEDSGQNIFLSPASIAMALAMTYNGAAGETQQAMAQVLEFQGMTIEEINNLSSQMKGLLEHLDPKVQLTIANSLWLNTQQNLPNPIKEEFLNCARESYGADVETLNLNDPAAPDSVNAWVSRHTNGKIRHIVDETEELELLLVNALYFKGKWSAGFDETRTREGAFTLLHGTERRLPMMTQHGEYRYYGGDGFQAVRLPYGEGRVGMYMFLPNEASSLAAFLHHLTAENWEIWMAQFEEEKGSITLPRFTLEYGADLNGVLRALGMGIAFDGERANFEGIRQAPPPLAISQVLHKTVLEVNEEGTEAAAAAVVGIMLGASFNPKRGEFSMVIDRPFFCAIVDDTTGAILFMGSVVEPQ